MNKHPRLGVAYMRGFRRKKEVGTTKLHSEIAGIIAQIPHETVLMWLEGAHATAKILRKKPG